MIRPAAVEIAIALTVAMTVGTIPVRAGRPADPPSVASGTSFDDDAGKPAELIATADFNRDGIADLAEVSSSSQGAGGPRSLVVLLGQADGSFKKLDSIPALGSDPRCIVVGDFNRDGNPDVIVGDGDGTVIELVGDGKGNLVSAGAIAHLESTESIAMGDFNHDGSPDLAISDSHANAVSVLLGKGDGAFDIAWSFPLPMRGAVFHLAAADFNGDGVDDLVVSNENDDAYEVMLGNGNGTFTLSPELSRAKDPYAHCPA